MKKITLFHLALLFLLGSSWASFAQAGPPQHAACARDKARIKASDLPKRVEPGTCDFGDRIIYDGITGTQLPNRGTEMYTEVLTDEGAEQFEVAHLEDGAVVFEGVGSEIGAAVTDGGGGTGPADCSDAAYTDSNVKVRSTLDWWFNRGTSVSEISPDNAEAAIRSGGTNITQAFTNCLGQSDNVDVSLNYRGGTDKLANITDGGLCFNYDLESVVSFGALPVKDANNSVTTLATECTKTSLDYINNYKTVETSDVKLNNRVNWTIYGNLSTCSGRWDLEGIMTHERGHTVGIGHVSESGHKYMTMSDKANGTCQISERTLGLGDIRGLENKY